MGKYAEFVGKRVVMVHNLNEANAKGEMAEELEGTIEAENEAMVMVKPKGKTQPTLLETASIESVRHADVSAKKLGRKTLKVVPFGNARAHLLERHGITLEWVNSNTEQAAFDYHEGLDHEASDLGHVHGEKKAADEGAED